MKTIGIIGGMSYESSIHYYERINDQVNKIAGGLTCAKMIIYNVNFEEIRKEDLAKSFQKVSIEAITSKLRKAIIENNIKNVIVAGGVAASQGLRNAMQELTEELSVELSIPPMKYCTDNAAMIAAAGYYAYQDGRLANLELNSKSQDTLK